VHVWLDGGSIVNAGGGGGVAGSLPTNWGAGGGGGAGGTIIVEAPLVTFAGLVAANGGAGAGAYGRMEVPCGYSLPETPGESGEDGQPSDHPAAGGYGPPGCGASGGQGSAGPGLAGGDGAGNPDVSANGGGGGGGAGRIVVRLGSGRVPVGDGTLSPRTAPAYVVGEVVLESP
jgi:hypothetical protein